jgi:5-enolpyruvylshikimate-3-phosphate synthase
LLSGDEVVAVLYGDNAVTQRPIEDTASLEVFLSQAGFAFQTAGRARPPLDVNLVTRELIPVRV